MALPSKKVYSEFGGGPDPKPPRSIDQYPVKTPGRRLRAGYRSGTDDITDPPDRRAWTGESEENPYADSGEA